MRAGCRLKSADLCRPGPPAGQQAKDNKDDITVTVVDIFPYLLFEGKTPYNAVAASNGKEPNHASAVRPGPPLPGCGVGGSPLSDLWLLARCAKTVCNR